MTCPLCRDTGKIAVDDYSKLERRVKDCPVCYQYKRMQYGILYRLGKEWLDKLSIGNILNKEDRL